MAKDDKDLIATALQEFERCRNKERLNRDNWTSDVRFARLGEQWPDSVRKQREQEGRPCLTINRMPAFIRQVVNDARQNTPSIKFHPVGDGADKETAKILDGLARNIEYTSCADVAYDNALEDAVSGGFGYFRVSTDYAGDDTFDLDIRIDPIRNPLSVYGDYMSMCADSSDWNVCFVTEMYSDVEFKRKWPKAELADWEASSKDGADWFGEDEVRVAEWWSREEVPTTLVKLSNGTVMLKDTYEENIDFFDALQVTVITERPSKTMKVTQRIMSGAEILETNEWAGKYIPIVPVYGEEVVVDGQRHFMSLVRFAKDPQQMLNFWRTASTELVALAPKTPFVGAVGQFATDAMKWDSANTVSYSRIEYDAVDVNGTLIGPPQRQPFAGPPAGALQEAINASDDMKSIMGIFDASLGAQSNEVSGRAILARQREGDVGTFHFTDNLSRSIRHCGRILCDMIPKVYSGPRMMRVIHEDGTNESVPVNGMQPPPQHMQAANDQQMAAERQAEQGVARVFDLTNGKYDVTCETGPSYTTRREEAANQMIEFTRAMPQSAALIGDLLAKNLDWPGADEIAERLKKMLPPQIQGQDPAAQAMQQQMAQLQQALTQCQQQLNDKNADRAVDQEKVRIDSRKADIDAYKAETDRLAALGLTLKPEAASALGMQTAQQAMASPDILPPQQQPQQQAPDPQQIQQAMQQQMMQQQQSQPMPPQGMQPGEQ